MNMICDDCQHKVFLLDYDAVKKISSAGICASIQLADLNSNELHCANCFGNRIKDISSGKFVNDTPEHLKTVFQLAELPASQRMDFGAYIQDNGFHTKNCVFSGHIYQQDFPAAPQPRQDAIGVLAEMASLHAHEAVSAILEQNSVELHKACSNSGAGVSIRMSLVVYTESDAQYAEKPEFNTPSYGVVLD